MGLIRLVHSLNIRPWSIDCYNLDARTRMVGNLWFFATSVAYAKRSGANIVLHTDSLGADILGHLPYDSIILSMESFPSDIHPRFWAAGKILALRAEGAGALHIDGDVFIKKRSLLEEISRQKWDVYAQGIEGPESDFFYGLEMPVFDTDPDFCRLIGLDYRVCGAYNTGLLGFRDAGLLRQWTDGYLALARHFSVKARALLDNNNMQTPDIITEQRWLYQFCRNSGADVSVLFPVPQRTQADAVEKGFQHVLTAGKFARIDKCRAVLKSIAPDIYSKTEKVCQKFLGL